MSNATILAPLNVNLNSVQIIQKPISALTRYAVGVKLNSAQQNNTEAIDVINQ